MTMAERRRPALGRGMAALLGSALPPQGAFPPGRGLLALPIESLERGAQPRKRFDEKALDELAASIREHGVVEPILVRREGSRYRILAGERRWRAAQRAGLREVPALLREANDREAFELALVENLQRTDLNAIEEAEAFEVLVREHGLSQEAVAARVGKDRSTVANALRLLKLPADVRDLVRDGSLEMGHARALLSLSEPEAIRKMAQRAAREGHSVRATEALVRHLLHPERKGHAGRENASTRDLAQRLQRRLGARSRVVPRTATAGRLEIHYTSLEELEGILTRMGA
jgi:ParB family transcriptional regulator, chromosome partitioning protein